MMRSIYKIWWQRKNQKKNSLVNGDLDTAWRNIKQVWEKADTVYRGAVGFAAEIKVEYDLLERFIKFQPQSEEKLIEGIQDKNPIIAAYSALALDRINSRYLSKIDTSLLERDEIVYWRLCSFGGNTTLKNFFHLHGFGSQTELINSPPQIVQNSDEHLSLIDYFSDEACAEREYENIRNFILGSIWEFTKFILPVWLILFLIAGKLLKLSRILQLSISLIATILIPYILLFIFNFLIDSKLFKIIGNGIENLSFFKGYCPRCNGELRTPLAKQCRHCHYDWH